MSLTLFPGPFSPTSSIVLDGARSNCPLVLGRRLDQQSDISAFL